MVLKEVVGALELVVGGPAGHDLLVVEGGGCEPDPGLRDVLVRADHHVRVGGPHVERDDALQSDHGHTCRGQAGLR